jgi:hypothetical protein
MNNDTVEMIAVAVAAAMAEQKDGDRLWSAKTIAEYMDIGNYRQVLDRYAPHPDFPKAIRVPIAGGGRGQPRWKASEVKAWWCRYQEDHECRRRAGK